MKHSRCSISLLFYSLWIVLSVTQAVFTELFHDEAYYWMYSKNLAWGYFDHPPMIALIIKMGWLFFQNELGVRLFIILLNTGTIFVIERIIQPRNLKLYYALIASIVLIHYGGVLAVPDIPLLFFTTTFFYLYKRYTEKPSWVYMLLIGINAGLLLLSKYHGILVIGFTLLSNISLLKKWSTWMAMLVTFIVFLPHMIWQHNHNYPTINYHLFHREVSAFDYTYILEFIFTQPLVYGPIVGFILLYFGFIQKPTNVFEQALKFNIIGVFLLFFIFTFKGKVEAHWTDITFLGLVYFGYHGIENSERLKKFIYITLPVSLFLIIGVRLFLMVDYLPEKLHVKTEFHGWDKWAEEIKAVSNDYPVVFANSYQNAAKYEFYSGITSTSLNDQKGRKNQYNIWKTENKLQGSRVLYLPNFYTKGVDSLQTSVGWFYRIFLNDFQTYPDVNIIVDRETERVKSNDSIVLKIVFEEGSKIGETAQSSETDSVWLNAAFFNIHNQMVPVRTNLLVTDEMIKNKAVQYVTVYPPDTGRLSIYLSLSNSWFLPTVHTYRKRIIVE